MKNWQKTKQKKLNYIRKRSERAAILAESNYGRNFGWLIEYKEEIIGELNNCIWERMFWDSYKVIPYKTQYEGLLFDREEWHKYEFKLKNKFTLEYCEPFYGFDQDLLDSEKRLTTRGLSLSATNDDERKLISNYGDFLRKIPEDEKKLTNFNFRKLVLQKYLNNKKNEYYFIEIHRNSTACYCYNLSTMNRKSYSFEVKKNDIVKIQNIIDKYSLFKKSPSKLNQSRIKNLMVEKLTKAETFNIFITNELEERHCSFNIVNWKPSKEQAKLLDFFKKIELIIKPYIPSLDKIKK